MKCSGTFTAGFMSLALIAAFNSSSMAMDDPGSAELERVIAGIVKAVGAGDRAEVGKVSQALFPDEARLRRALGETSNASVMERIQMAVVKFATERIIRFHSEAPKGAPVIEFLFQNLSGESTIKIHAATAEEISRYVPGTVGGHYFTGYERDLAREKILRAGLTFYNVDLRDPVRNKGFMLHMLYWDGNSWSILGQVGGAVWEKPGATTPSLIP